MATRKEALELMHEWVKSESLRRHCLGVSVCMEKYAEKYAEKYVEEGKLSSHPPDPSADADRINEKSENNVDDGDDIVDKKSAQKLDDNSSSDIDNNNQTIIDKYWICGLLHDFDWEKYPNIDEHPIKGCQYLKEKSYPTDIIEAILGHNKATGIKRYSLMAKTLFAVDELSGLVIALARVRPENFDGMTAKSVKKAMKKKDFAAAISRDDIKQGMEELGLKEDDVEGRNAHFELVISALNGIKEELGFE